MRNELKKELRFIGNEGMSLVKNRTFRTLSVAYMFLLAAAATLLPAQASTADIINGMLDGMSEIYYIITWIAIPLVVIMLAYSGIQLAWGGEKGIETAKKTISRMFFAIVLVFLAPTIVLAIKSWFDSNGDGGVFDHVTD